MSAPATTKFETPPLTMRRWLLHINLSHKEYMADHRECESGDGCQIPAQANCRQCGICCEKGGPALHTQDLVLITDGFLPLKSIITIRRGEFVHDPVTNAIGPSKTELLKISGANGVWTCLFYDRPQKGCSIYDHRPLACQTLKCWDTKPILKLSGRNLLSRLDLVAPETRLGKRLIEHEALFPFPDLRALVGSLSHIPKKALKKLERTVNKDLDHRAGSIDVFHLSVEQELFYFGRPIFHLLEPFGFTVRETASGIKIKAHDRNKIFQNMA